ncbi:hypothetical protein Tco_0945757 [Tanacetum coccineum]
MYTSRNDYLVYTLRFVSAKEATQIYEAILPESLTSLEMKETKAYKTYLGFATEATPLKIARKFKKDSPSNKDLNLNLVPVEEEPKSAKKKTSSKRKEKVDVTRGKGIELLSEVALTEDAQFEDSCQEMWMRDSHRNHQCSGKFTKLPPSAKRSNLLSQ